MPHTKPALQDTIRWDISNWSRALPIWLEALAEGPMNDALALGEREGGLSLWLATQGVQVTCTDLNPLPPETFALHTRHGVRDHIRYAQVDATRIPYPDASFDVVVFKSMIGALGSKEAQTKAVAEMQRVLRPGGVLLFAENLAGTAMHGWLRKRYVSWEHYWRYLRWPADRDLFRTFARSRFESFGLFANLGRSEVQRGFLGRVDACLLPLLPRSWRYILVGACRKA